MCPVRAYYRDFIFAFKLRNEPLCPVCVNCILGGVARERLGVRLYHVPCHTLFALCI